VAWHVEVQTPDVHIQEGMDGVDDPAALSVRPLPDGDVAAVEVPVDVPVPEVATPVGGVVCVGDVVGPFEVDAVPVGVAVLVGDESAR
jgi:hypothetical protein